MDLPPDKARVLRGYDEEKKWEMMKDLDKVTAKESPEFYLRKLVTYLDPKASRSAKKRRLVGDSTSTQVLRELEISLRTNSIEWVREFLSESNNGLDVLIEYLTFRLATQQQKLAEMIKSRDGSVCEDGTDGENRVSSESDPNVTKSDGTGSQITNSQITGHNGSTLPNDSRSSKTSTLGSAVSLFR